VTIFAFCGQSSIYSDLMVRHSSGYGYAGMQVGSIHPTTPPFRALTGLCRPVYFANGTLAHVQISSHHAHMSIGMVQAWVAHFVTHKKYAQRVRLTSHESETTHKAQITYQTPSQWCWSRLPLQRRGFDEPMPPEGWAALRMFILMPPSKGFNRFIKLKYKLIN